MSPICLNGTVCFPPPEITSGGSTGVVPLTKVDTGREVRLQIARWHRTELAEQLDINTDDDLLAPLKVVGTGLRCR